MMRSGVRFPPPAPGMERTYAAARKSFFRVLTPPELHDAPCISLGLACSGAPVPMPVLTAIDARSSNVRTPHPPADFSCQAGAHAVEGEQGIFAEPSRPSGCRGALFLSVLHDFRCPNGVFIVSRAEIVPVQYGSCRVSCLARRMLSCMAPRARAAGGERPQRRTVSDDVGMGLPAMTHQRHSWVEVEPGALREALRQLAKLPSRENVSGSPYSGLPTGTWC